MKEVASLWGGELPEFDTIEAANELVGALVMGLWNHLSRHQERSNPFRLIRLDAPATREGLSALALMRRQELDGFVAGLFGQETTIDLPERASRGLDALGEMRALMAAVLDMANDETKPASGQDIQATLRNMREMTKIAEHEMHAASCLANALWTPARDAVSLEAYAALSRPESCAGARDDFAGECEMLEARFLKRLNKKARKGLRGWPVATIAFYGPNLSRATK
ncbi:MAG: hypothetical protein WBO09_02370, partial [Methylocystis silviterrae]